MKIIHIIYSGLGGHGSVLFSLLKNLKKIKTINSIVFFYGKKGVLSFYKNQCLSLKLKSYYFKSDIFFNNIKMFLNLRKQNPDKIILHTSSIIPVIIYKLFYKVLFIKVLHTDIKLYKINDWIIFFLSILFGDMVIVLNSEYKKKLVNKIPDFLKKKIYVIPPGIKVNYKIKPKKISQKNKILIGMAARFDHGKRQDILIDTISELNKFNREFNIYLSLVGNGKEYNKYQKRVTKSIKNKVIFKGILSNKDMLKWYKSLDIYVHASDYEVVNTSILEAMSLRIPIIASNISSINYQIIDGYKCGLVNKNNSSMFKKNLIYLLNNKKLYYYFSQNTFKQINKKYNFKKYLYRYIKILLDENHTYYN